jgi:hypothetical protein
MTEIVVKVKEIKVNINNHCRVKLTPKGIAIYREHFSKYQHVDPNPKLDSEGYLREQLWSIIHIFGSELFSGIDSTPFEGD